MEKLKALFDTVPETKIYENGFLYESIDNTNAFAFIKFPDTPQPENGYPGIVYVHGGAGTAFEHIADLFTNQGYAVICMDNFGSSPSEWMAYKQDVKARKKVPGGMALDGLYWEESDLNYNNQWFYRVLSNCILARNILAACPKVNAACISLAGVSWGGITVEVLSDIDIRYNGIIAVYGCGFLDTPQSCLRDNYCTMMRHSLPFQPELHLKNAPMPILFINSDQDEFFPLKAWEKTVLCAPKHEKMLVPALEHNHEAFLHLPQTWEFLQKLQNC